MLNAKARRNLKQNKLPYWQNYVSKINSPTPLSQIWIMANDKKVKAPNVCSLKEGDMLLTDKSDKAS